LFFYVDPGRIACDVAAIWRTLGEWGVGIADRRVVVRGPLRYRPWSRGWADLFINTRLFPASQMTRGRMARYAATLKRFRPKYVFGYPSAVYRFCRFLEEENINMRESGIRITLAISEKLYDFQRASIERALGCRVVDFYSARDAGVMGIECPAGKRHVLENVVLETVEGGQPGRKGEIVVTHLGSYGMPFLRYKTGDLGALSEEDCACGRKAPVLQEIEGRVGDFIFTPGGGVVHSMAVLQALSLIPGMERIEQFQIIQESGGCLEVRLAVSPAWRAGLGEKIKTSFSKILGREVGIRVVFVDEIKGDLSGKSRPFVSQLPAQDRDKDRLSAPRR
jgi:phenylacetate-CoA ligase